MNLVKMNYKKYIESLKNTPEPLDLKDHTFDIKIKQVDMIKYAKSVNKQPCDLTDDEIAMFVVGGAEALNNYRKAV